MGGTRSRAGRSSGKRVRTIFTQEQLDRLEREFERQQYMVGTERCVSRRNLQQSAVLNYSTIRSIDFRTVAVAILDAILNNAQGCQSGITRILVMWLKMT